ACGVASVPCGRRVRPYDAGSRRGGKPVCACGWRADRLAGWFRSRKTPASRGGRIARAILLALVMLILIPYLLAPFYRFVDPVSTLMLWRRATGARVERRWVPPDHIAPALRLAVLAAEDDRFCSHHGVDLTELHGVIGGIEDVNDLAEVRGGSTITQQT